VAADGARLVQLETIVKLLRASGNRTVERGFGLDTHDDVRHLAERLVRSVRRELVLTLGGVNGDERVYGMLRSFAMSATRRVQVDRGNAVQFERGAHDDKR
jgi:hypothetical protein